ncbi:hypothetical protein EYZ11_008827 [Aspergillus tanneri]|uniref:Uncharacterized protein n=1 Tax=Aspergillus tanneri TaxID=1220188 RepID=A0A4V3UNM7_9EURO|nr:hypothetical protein EYZ11_008827 [Aspergillus tanneri]
MEFSFGPKLNIIETLQYHVNLHNGVQNGH